MEMVPKFMLDKIDLSQKTVKRDKGHYVMINGPIDKENTTVVKVCTPSIGIAWIY